MLLPSAPLLQLVSARKRQWATKCYSKWASLDIIRYWREGLSAAHSRVKPFVQHHRPQSGGGSGRSIRFQTAHPAESTSACSITVSVAFSSLSGGYPYLRRIRLTSRRRCARTFSRSVQSIVTLLRTVSTSSRAIPRRVSSPRIRLPHCRSSRARRRKPTHPPIGPTPPRARRPPATLERAESAPR